MVSLWNRRRVTPIAVDLGSRSVKLLQLSALDGELVEAARWDLPSDSDALSSEEREKQISEAIRLAVQGRNFRGRDAVLCLGHRQLFVQNIRVPKAEGPELDRVVQQEAAARIPFAIDEAEIRYLEAADVRQADAVKREVVLLACHRPLLEQALRVVTSAGLRPVGVDAEPNALLRCYTRLFRREEDRTGRTMFVHLGASTSCVVIARGDEALFVKYLAVGGQQMDRAVATQLNISENDAGALRRTGGDRRAEHQDAEVVRTVQQAVRPVFEKLLAEISLCLRYHNVTFRGQTIGRVILGGGEATAVLAETLAARLSLKCEMLDPLRTGNAQIPASRRSQWDIATGLALYHTHDAPTAVSE